MLRQESEAGFPDRFEIVRGEIVPLMPTGDVHSALELRVVRLLLELEDAGLGVARGGEVGVVVVHDPLTVRGADAAFILSSQIPYETSREGYLLTPPALVVEVVSPNDRLSEIQTKVLEYLEAGVRCVWVVDPASQAVTVYLPDQTARILRSSARLQAPGILEPLPQTVAWLFRGAPPAPPRVQP